MMSPIYLRANPQCNNHIKRIMNLRFLQFKFDFRKGLGACDALLTISNAVQKLLDCGQDVRMISFDFSSSFDRVNHEVLVFKLMRMGIEFLKIMMRRASGFSVCRRPLRSLLYVVSCIGAFMCGSLMTLMSVDPMSCDIHRCTEKIKRTDVEDTNSWLGMWGQNVKGPEKHVFLVIVILSAPNNVEHRDVIRQTWLSEEKSDTLHLFVVGTESLNESINTTIQSEQKRFGDMMLLTNVIDSYEALTRKLLAAFVYVHFNVKFRFFMKCDDDTFVQIPQLHRELKSVPYKQRLYWGFFDGRATPKKKGPWKEADWVLCDRYLPYALGGGYVLSSDVVTFIATNSKYLKLYKNEDVSLGTWVAPLDLHRVHDPRFDTEYKSRGCNNDYLVTHKQSTLHMREKFTSLKSTSLLCREQFQVRKSYHYNWNVPPSQCCIRNDSSLP